MDVKTSLEITRDHLAHGRVEQAESVLASAHAKWPLNAEVAVALCEVVSAQGRSEDAKAILDSTIARLLDLGDRAEEELLCGLTVLLQLAGRSADAEVLLCRLLVSTPRAVPLLNNLAVVRHAQGKFRGAIDAYNDSLAVRENQPVVHNNLGTLYQLVNADEMAEYHYRRAVAIDHNHAAAWGALAALMKRRGEAEAGAKVAREALLAARRVLQLRPADISARVAVAHAALDAGEPRDALHALEGMESEGAELWMVRGLAHAALDETEAAVLALERCTSSAGAEFSANLALGGLHLKVFRFEEALRCYSAALRIQPDEGHCVEQSAWCLQALGKYDEAISLAESHRRSNRSPASAILLARAYTFRSKHSCALDVLTEELEREEHWQLHLALSVCLARSGRFEEALSQADIAIALSDAPPARLARAIHLIFLGRLREAWEDYEARLQMAPSPKGLAATKPKWEGQDLRGKTILLRAEQGLGDTIQHVRFAEPFASRGARVVLQVQRPLRSLCKRIRTATEVVALDEEYSSYDYQLPLMSAPRALGTSISTIPGSVPYLCVDSTRVESWRSKIDGSLGLKVGLVWSGALLLPEHSLRNAALSDFRPLLGTRGARFFSLQVGPRALDLASMSGGSSGVVDLGSSFADFEDTAAAIQCLDLVITVDTSVGHLAGALGRPTWNLITSNWTGHMWMTSGRTTPWYPTMELFRQRVLGDWEATIEEMRIRLESLILERS